MCNEKQLQKDIIPYTAINLDCYQNILLTLLNYYGVDVNCFGSQWPWEFYAKGDVEDTADIRIKTILNPEIIEDKCNLKLEFINVPNESDSIYAILRKTVQSKPVIVKVDQYYVPHHYPHIYRKQHGKHALLLCGYDSERDAFECIDTIPSYHGFIDRAELLDGIINYNTNDVKYIRYISNTDQVRQKPITEVIDTLINDITNQDRTFEDFRIIDLKEIIQMIQKKKMEMNQQSYTQWMNKLFKSNWIWNADRNGNYLISFLNYLSDYLGDEMLFQKSIEDVVRLNQTMNIVLKRMFKLTLVNKIGSQSEIFDQLQSMLCQEELVRSELLRTLSEVKK